jgi:hypothetical protein
LGRESVSSADWQKEQEHFEEQFTALEQPEDMMLVCVEAPDLKSACYIVELPDDVPLDHFAGFAKISEYSLPDKATLLIGYEDHFKKLFGSG